MTTHHQWLLLDGPRAGEVISVHAGAKLHKIAIGPSANELISFYFKAEEPTTFTQYVYEAQKWFLEGYVYKVASCEKPLSSFEGWDVDAAIEASGVLPYTDYMGACGPYKDWHKEG